MWIELTMSPACIVYLADLCLNGAHHYGSAPLRLTLHGWPYMPSDTEGSGLDRSCLDKVPLAGCNEHK